MLGVPELTGYTVTGYAFMEKISWDDKFAIGNERIDFEHRIFVDLIRIIQDSYEAGDPPERIKRLIDELEKYSRFHFLSEENIMIDIGYPAYESHKMLHLDLLQELNYQKNIREITKSSIEQFLEFLFYWFVNHTINEDRKIIDYLK